MQIHQPVLPAEVLEYLVTRGDGVYCDATLGLGGHASRLLEQFPETRLIGIDRDAESLTIARENLAGFGERATYIHGHFSQLGTLLAQANVEQVDGILADLGASYYQLRSAERGFSFQSDGELDMRQDRSQGETAADVVNFSSEKILADLIYQLGEERRARRVARSIVRGRPIRSTLHLATVIGGAVPRQWTHAVIQRTFMALRMSVNRELEELEALLAVAPGLVRPGGRIVVITFHSLEDRIVKHTFQKLAREGRVELLTRKVVRPGEGEVERNAAARSAKLRAVEISSAG